MPDQAAGLRSLFARRRPSLLIVAGSDACKAAVAVHYAREAGAGGRATLLVDGTAGQIAMVCDVPCRYELAHVLAGDLPLTTVLRPLGPHLLLLPAARALSRFGTLSAEEGGRLADTFSHGIAAAFASAGAGEPQVDLVVINAAEGHAARAVEAFGRDARIVIVATDRPASLRGAYAELKSLTGHGIENIELVTPRFDAGSTPSVAFTNLATAARRFLEIELMDGGSVLLTPPCEEPGTRSSGDAPVHAADDVEAAPADVDIVATSHPPVLSSHPSNVEVHHAAVA